MTYLFISDLHLSANHPRLVRGFLALLAAYQQKNTQLYILGDWFNRWIGDDDPAPWLQDIVSALQQFSQAGNQIFFVVGNRDFALGEKFLSQFQGQFLAEQTQIRLGNYQIRLEHGDLLCVDDVAYQRFRKIIRFPPLLRLLTAMPLSFREKLAQGFRKKSQQANQLKSYTVMDVNEQAVEQALSSVDVLIHGHTHRPKIHTYHAKKRIVLGDWGESEAQILVICDENLTQPLQLSVWHY